VITQRNESSQSHLLNQIWIFFDYFWSIEFSSIRATIISFQSILSSQCAEINSSEERITTRWAIIQRSESFQSHLLNQISIFFNYFWSIELNWFRATIMSLKVCEIVSAQKSIQARKDDDSWKIKSSTLSIFLNAFAESNLHLFPWFLNRSSHLDQLNNSCHRKYWAQEHLKSIQVRWWIDWEWNDESTCQANHYQERLRASSQ